MKDGITQRKTPKHRIIAQIRLMVDLGIEPGNWESQAGKSFVEP